MQGIRRPHGAPQLHHPFGMHDQSGQPRLDLPPPLPPVPTAAPVVVPHDMGQLAFDPGMVLAHRRVAECRGPFPRRVILRLVIRIDHTPPLLLGQCRQILRLQPTPGTLAAVKTHSTRAVGTALLRGRLLAPWTLTTPADVNLYPHALGRTQGPQGLAVPGNPVDRHRRDRVALHALFCCQQCLGIAGLVAVAGQEVERREPLAVSVHTAIEPRPRDIGPMRATPGVRINDTAHLVALVRLIPIRQDGMGQRQRGLKAVARLVRGRRQRPQVVLERIGPPDHRP